MLNAWMCRSACVYTIVVGAILLQITTDADPTLNTYKVCPEKRLSVGTRVRNGVSRCEGCDELRNCTSVYGSVHLKGISFRKNESLRNEFRFPKLREITGHLIVTFLDDVSSLDDILPNLSVIHGRVEGLFEGYALVVYLNKGLQNLGLNSLTVIKQGGIKIEFNQKLCYLDRVRWQSMMDYGVGKKYELALKGNSKDCFAKCSESCRTPPGHGSSGYAYCWGGKEKNCQKLCGSECGSGGCQYGTQGKCCDKQCLGGCTQAQSPHHCNACQHLRLDNGTCVSACPAELKELENFICVEKCPKEIPLVVDGKCFKDCPAGYTKKFPWSKRCDKCAKDDCPRVCQRSILFKPKQKINLLSDTVKLKGCTIFVGNLEIELKKVPGGTNLAQLLNEHLGNLQKIYGYVVVRQSSPLISLNFFKNLKTIETRGSGFSAKGYALAIFDNPNLESLWDFHPEFTIRRKSGGKPHDSNGIFVQLNPRLCLFNIYPLIEDVLKWNRTDERVDISKTTNGNAKTCDVNLVNITLTPVKCSRFHKEICVQVSWPNKVADYRNVLLYSVWYRETTSRDLNEHDDIDACSSDHVWNRQDGNSEQRRDTITEIVDGLKAYTLYAFRVEAIVIAGKGVKSSITYFETKQTKPSMPRNLEVNFLSPSALQVKWREPFFPNGDITRYVIHYHESQSRYMWNINIDWCEDQADSSTNFYKRNEKKKEESRVNNSCAVNITCDCASEKDKKLAPDLKEALFSKRFQDKILTAVFIKIDDKKTNKSSTSPTVVTARTGTVNVMKNKTTPTLHEGCDNNSKNSSCSSVRPNTNVTATSTPTIPVSTLPQPTTTPVDSLNTTEQTITVKALKYFTEYTFEVCACNSGAGCGENKGFITQCATAVGRTEKNDTADNVGNTLTVQAKNATNEFTLKWQAPARPNGVVLKYDIWIENKDIRGNETIIKTPCVLASKTSYTRQGASFGDYTVRVRAITPVGNGSWSNEVAFRLKEQVLPPEMRAPVKETKLVTVVGVSIGALLAVVIVLAILSYFFIQRHKKNGKGAGVIYSSTNPEYWNCSEVYVPDEWEVPRKNITLIRELGNGSFGMVWEGEAVDILPGVQCCKVAVKTVSDNSSIRDKVEFLKEASIMKAFNCNHVLRLLGVVSAGDPVLVIMELMENGDLKNFLRSRRPDEEDSECSLPPPTDVELFQMAAEIADGMAYLGDRKFVHRDLAARNCMVSSNFTCKIGDFGMARDVYETDYYRKGGKGFLPVRWMAPESLKDGVFCSASDVWSYGVVLWEMATLAEQPYQGKSNEEVMKYVLDGDMMDVPESCPHQLKEIMLLCWQYKPKMRTTFVSVVEALEGYLSIEFTERSFYHNDRPRKETDASSCYSFGTENDNLSELPDVLTIPNLEDPEPRESFV